MLREVATHVVGLVAVGVKSMCRMWLVTSLLVLLDGAAAAAAMCVQYGRCIALLVYDEGVGVTAILLFVWHHSQANMPTAFTEYW